jgi:hypothetical protein
LGQFVAGTKHSFDWPSAQTLGIRTTVASGTSQGWTKQQAWRAEEPLKDSELQIELLTTLHWRTGPWAHLAFGTLQGPQPSLRGCYSPGQESMLGPLLGMELTEQTRPLHLCTRKKMYRHVPKLLPLPTCNTLLSVWQISILCLVVILSIQFPRLKSITNSSLNSSTVYTFTPPGFRLQMAR